MTSAITEKLAEQLAESQRQVKALRSGEYMERACCMNDHGDIWCRVDAHSIYCAAGVARAALKEAA